MHPVLNNTFLFRELYFDVDYEMETFEQSAAETKKLLEWYREQNIVSDQEPVVVFSGGKDFISLTSVGNSNRTYTAQ